MVPETWYLKLIVLGFTLAITDGLYVCKEA